MSNSQSITLCKQQQEQHYFLLGWLVIELLIFLFVIVSNKYFCMIFGSKQSTKFHLLINSIMMDRFLWLKRNHKFIIKFSYSSESRKQKISTEVYHILVWLFETPANRFRCKSCGITYSSRTTTMRRSDCHRGQNNNTTTV